MTLPRLLCVSLCVWIAGRSAYGQTIEQALSKASTAFSQGKPVASVTLAATANWIAGSDKEAGNATLTAHADGSFTVQLNLEKGSRTDSQTAFTTGPSCTYAGADGVDHSSAGPNCMISLAWFMPGVSLFGGKQPDSVAIVLTSENSPSQPYLHLRQQQSSATSASPSIATLLTHLSTLDLYLDPSTFLTSILDYKIHPDNNAGADIPVQVLFTNYKTVDGVSIPFRIQRYVNGVLNLDLSVTQASAN